MSFEINRILYSGLIVFLICIRSSIQIRVLAYPNGSLLHARDACFSISMTSMQVKVKVLYKSTTHATYGPILKMKNIHVYIQIHKYTLILV